MVDPEKAMLRELGMETMDDLFAHLPPEVRVPAVDLPPGLSEAETVRSVRRILGRNRDGEELVSFLGAGYYDMYVPAAVDAIVGRSEFYTSYTPYQAELSQGLMQALFEYQSLICELTGMEAANSSLYDGASALGEAALMCARISRRGEFLVPQILHWEKRSVLANYARGAGLTIREVPPVPGTARLDGERLEDLVTSDTAGIYVEMPNFLGLLDPGLLTLKEDHPDVLLVVGVQPLSLAVVRPPGDYGADIVVGEGQPLGNRLSFGGPSLGLFACRREHMRRMPGRVIGLTQDAAGNRAFAMTLQTREQHIRKERAMSNICTNESLLAIATAVYLGSQGSAGLRSTARRLLDRAASLAARIDRVEGFRAPLFEGTYFNEVPVGVPGSPQGLTEHLLGHGIHSGLDVSRLLPEAGSVSLFAVTDRHREEHLDRLIKALEGWG